MAPEDVTWVICSKAQPTAARSRTVLGADRYEDFKNALKASLCDYFLAVTNCDGKQGKSISPVKPTAGGV